VLGLAGATLAGAGTTLADNDPPRRLRRLVGAWDVIPTVVIQNTVFPALLTFTSDGIVLADEPPSPFETTGHGNWVSTGRRSAAFTFMALIGSAEGPLSLRLKVVGELELDEDGESWSGPFRIHILDPGGNAVLVDTGTFTATRVAIERLS
jgi:hypothetical protein